MQMHYVLGKFFVRWLVVGCLHFVDTELAPASPAFPFIAVSFRTFSFTTVKDETSYYASTLNRLFEKYYQYMAVFYSATAHSFLKMQYNFYLCFKYINLYPTCQQMPSVLKCRGQCHGERGGGPNKNYFTRNCMPMMRVLEIHIDEFRWDMRLDRMNHVPWLPNCFTTVWDSTPFEIETPRDGAVNYRTRSGKDKMNCFKAMFGITLTGRPCAYMGLMLPKIYDAWVMRSIDHKYTPLPHEFRIGDGHFSTVPNCLCPPRKPTWTRGMKSRGEPEPHLSAEQQALHQIIQLIRAPVEPLMKEMKKCGMWGRPFRGAYHNMQTFFEVSVNARALEMYIIADQTGERRRGFGPMAHNIT